MTDKQTNTNETSNPAQGLKNTLNRIGARFSEDGLINFDFRVMLVMAACLLGIAAGTIGKVSGSSVRVWNDYIPGDSSKQVTFGSSKWIRFDEWCLQTPLTSAQFRSGMTSSNPALGAGNTPLIMSLPVKAFPSILRPQFFGFFLFDFEHGFSFYWNYKAYGLFISSFFVLLLLTRNNFWFSFLGALWLYYSSYMQWWFSTGMPDMIMAVCIIIIGLIYLIHSKRKSFIYSSAIALVIYTLTFIFLFYPPYQITVGYMLLLIVAGYTLRQAQWDDIRSLLTTRLVVTAGGLAAITACLLIFYSQAKDTITIMTQTLYPGNRISVGGVIPFGNYLSGMFDFLYKERVFPKAWGNVCEASNFMLVYPFVIVAIGIDMYKKRSVDILNILLIAYILFLSAWVLVGFPEIIAKLTLMTRIRENRAFLAIGISNIVLVVNYLAGTFSKRVAANPESKETSSTKVKAKKSDTKKQKASQSKSLISFEHVNATSLIGAAALFGVLYYSASLMNDQFAGFFSKQTLVLVCALFGFLAFLVLSRLGIIFLSVVVAISIYGNFWVNPISIGLTPLFEKQLMHTLDDIRAKDPDAKWIAYGSNILANYLIASGVNCIDGTKFLPDMDMMKIFDPDRKNELMYNRFAHVHCLPYNPDSKDPNVVKFILDNDDAFTLCVSPRSEQLKTIGVKYFMSNRTFTKEDLQFIEPMYDDAINGMYLYKRRDGKRFDSEETLSKLRQLPAAQFRVEHLNVAANSTHDRFIVTGWAYDLADNCVPPVIYADVNGHLVEAKMGLYDATAPEERFRAGGFRIEVPYTRLGTGNSEIHLQVLNKDKSGFGTAPTPLGVALN